jgi:GNAT superfamily N-acetyltransferase
MNDVWSNPTIEEDRARGAGTEAAEAPGPGFLESIGLGFRAARSGPDWGQNQNNYEGRIRTHLRQLLKAKGIDLAEAYSDPRGGGMRIADRLLFDSLARIRESDPDFASDYAEVSDEATMTAFARRQRLADYQAAGAALDNGSTAGSLVGALGAGLVDPTSYIPIAGPASKGASVARQILGVAGREAAANAAMTAALEPLVQMDSAALGVERTAGDFLTELGVSAVAGGVIGGAVKGGEVVVGRALERRRAAGTEADRGLLDALEAGLPPDMRTPDEAAAAHVVRREAEIREASPFEPGPAGDDAHAARLEEMLDAMVKGGPLPEAEPPALPPPSRGRTEAPERDAAVRWVMETQEGGAKLVTDSGGLTKYGVSQKAHPHLDIANLTRADAERIYRETYWEPLGLDRHAPDAALVAFDAAINHGPGFARRMLRDGAGDPARMLALRRAEYARLIADNPGKYARYERGWENRLRKLEARLGREPGAADAVPDADGAAEPAPTYADLDIADVPEPPELRGEVLDEWLQGTPEVRRAGREAAAAGGIDDPIEAALAARAVEVKPKRRRSRGPASLLDFIRSAGGIEDRGGDLAAMGLAPIDGFAPKGTKKLIRPHSDAQPGMLGQDGLANSNSPDEIVRRAWEAGYFPEHAERPDIGALYGAIDEELRGAPRYRLDDREELEAARIRSENLAAEAEWKEIAAEVDAALGPGMADTQDWRVGELALRFYRGGQSAEEAWTDAADIVAQEALDALGYGLRGPDELGEADGGLFDPGRDDLDAGEGVGRSEADPSGAGAGGTLAPPDEGHSGATGPFDPLGPEAKAQADSLEHDLRMVVEATVRSDAVSDFIIGPAMVKENGTPGISIERADDGSIALAVFRDADGQAKGSVVVPLVDEAATNFGGIVTYVDPAFRRRGIATRLYQTARAEGLPIDRYSGKGDLTPDGAAFVNALRVRDGAASTGFRVSDEGETDLKAILDDLDAEAKAIEEMRGCMAPPKGGDQ